MSSKKTEILNTLFKKFLIIYTDIEAIVITNPQAVILYVERRREDFIKTLDALSEYIKPRLESIHKKKSAFVKYGIATLDSAKYRHMFIRVNIDTILYLVLNHSASIDEIEPYALFLAEKISLVINLKEDSALLQTTMPSFQYESGIFEKYKAMMGLEAGGIYRFKFCIIGDNAVGKTSSIRQFVEGKFDKDYKSTIGLNIVTHSFPLLDNDINAVIWDLGGQQHYHKFRRNYYNGTQAAFIIFDLTRRESFENAKEYWYVELKEFTNPGIPIILIGNKSDLTDKRKVKMEEGQRLADELAEKENSLVSYIETSAKNGENIEEAFGMVAYQYIMKTKEEESKYLQEDLIELINSILDKRPSLELSFFSESLLWSPAVKILTSIKKLGEFELVKDEDGEQVYKYKNGLTFKNNELSYRDVSKSDGICCIFDAIGAQHIEAHWRELVIKIIQVIDENIELLVGIRVVDEEHYGIMLEEFDLDAELEKKMVNISFFKLGDEFQLDIYDQLKNLLNSIKFYV